MVSRHRHCGRVVVRRGVSHASISLRPLAPRALPRFGYDERSDFPAAALRRPLAGWLWPHERRLGPRGSLCLVAWPSEHSAPNHLTAPAVALTHNPSARQAVWASPFTSRLAGRPGRIGFVILRTARSPPVALHPLLRGRSYFQLQAGVCKPEEDFHLSDQTTSQTH